MPSRTFGGLHGYGYVQDPTGHMVTPVERLFSVFRPRGKKGSLRKCLTDTYDQGATSRCVGFAVKRAVQLSTASKGLTIDVSANCIYTMARCVDRTTLVHLTDDGAYPNQAMRGITLWGIAEERNWPSLSSTVNKEPGLVQLRNASKLKLNGYYKINSTGQQLIDSVCTAIDLGYPVCFAVNVDMAFEDYTGIGHVTAANPNNILGGHYLCAFEHDTLFSGEKVFAFSNSWGSSWGNMGVGVGDAAFMMACMDPYVMSIEVVT